MYGFLICMRDLPVIKPDTRNTQVRGPEASRQARKLPLPESFRFVTSITTPPRPPTDSAPPPSAPGNAGQPELGQFADVLGADGGGFETGRRSRNRNLRRRRHACHPLRSSP